MRLGFIMLLFSIFTESVFGKMNQRKASRRVISGKQVGLDDQSYIVSIEYYEYHFCGGSIISNEWILTAAYCLDDLPANDISVRVGSSTIEKGGTLYSVDKVITHPKYNVFDWDYGLLHLSTPLNLEMPGVKVIKLATSEPAPNTTITVTGWGVYTLQDEKEDEVVPGELQDFTLQVLQKKTCNKAYNVTLSSRYLCGSEEKNSVCLGDSGAPLVSPETKEQVGIVSWRFGCVLQKYPGLYSNVAAGREWIKEITGI